MRAKAAAAAKVSAYRGMPWNANAETLRVEAARTAFLLERDGDAATIVWVKRTLGIYRRAVLNPGHFASTASTGGCS